MPRHDRALGFVTSIADPSTGLLNENCTILPVYIFTEDHKATTIEHVIHAVQDYQSQYQSLESSIKFNFAFQPPEGEKKYPTIYSNYGKEIDHAKEGFLDYKEFSEDEWIDFGYKNNFNTRYLNTQRLSSLFQDENLDQYDTKEIKDIYAARTAIQNLFNDNPNLDAITYKFNETNFRLASGTVGIMHATNEVIETS